MDGKSWDSQSYYGVATATGSGWVDGKSRYSCFGVATVTPLATVGG